MAKNYRLAQSTVNALVPFFEGYLFPLAVTFGLLLMVLCVWWIHAEWQATVPFKQRLPRCLFLLSNASLLTLCLLNPTATLICTCFLAPRFTGA
jgi:hypothetical protein